jgi:methylphosphotriester-DNA--protein-cysteine methyltransferase
VIVSTCIHVHVVQHRQKTYDSEQYKRLKLGVTICLSQVALRVDQQQGLAVGFGDRQELTRTAESLRPCLRCRSRNFALRPRHWISDDGS